MKDMVIFFVMYDLVSILLIVILIRFINFQRLFLGFTDEINKVKDELSVMQNQITDLMIESRLSDLEVNKPVEKFEKCTEEQLEEK